MAPVATHTSTQSAPASLKLKQSVPHDAEAVARNQLREPLRNLGLIEQYPVRLEELSMAALTSSILSSHQRLVGSSKATYSSMTS